MQRKTQASAVKAFCTWTILIAAAATLPLAHAKPIKDDLPEAYAALDAGAGSLDPEFPGAYVVIRWPAAIDPAAEPMLREKFYGVNGRLLMDSKKDANPKKGRYVDKDSYALLTVRSTYYALELFTKLSQKLPPGHLVLDPQTITLTPAGKIELRSSETVSVPAALVLNFAASPSMLHIGGGGTRGKFVAPFVSAATAPSVIPQTRGALFKTANLRYGITDAAAPADGGTAFDGLQASYLEEMPLGPKTPVNTAIPTSDAPPIAPGAVLNIPALALEVPPDYVTSSAEASFVAKADTIQNPALDLIVALTMQALAKFDAAAAVAAGATRYAALYDPKLAEPAGAAPVEAFAEKVQMARAFAKIETKFLADRDAIIADTALNSEGFGQKHRAMRLAEKKANDKYNTTQAIGVFLTLATGGLALGAGSANFLAANTFMTTSFQAIQGITGSGERAAINTLVASTGGLVRATQEYSIDLPNQVVQVRAATIEELRGELKKIWSARFDPPPLPPEVIPVVTAGSAPTPAPGALP